MKYLETLNAVHSRLERLGDLPVFSATINRIQQISASPESDAMELAMAVMKDANLAARLLRLANSAPINRGRGQIRVISRAVVLIGFDEIKNLSVTLKLIECFNQDDNQTDIANLVLRSLLTATIAREIAAEARLDDIEQTYTCGLLFSLGEIVVALTLPERYGQMLEERSRAQANWSRIQVDALGGHFSDIGQDLAQSWGFPKGVTAAMDDMSSTQLKGESRFNQLLASRTQQLLEHIYHPEQSKEQSFSALLDDLGSALKLSPKQLTADISLAFRRVSDLVRTYGIPMARLTPPLALSGDEELDEISRKLSYFLRAQGEGEETQASPIAESALPETSDPQEPQRLHDQLETLGKISLLMSEGASAPKVLARVVEGMVATTGFSRCLLCLFNTAHDRLSPKILGGQGSEVLRDYFDMGRSRERELFFRLAEKQSTLLVMDLKDSSWSSRLPTSFLEQVAPRGFVLAPLGRGERSVGFLYADRPGNGEPVSEADFRCFTQFHTQARIALNYAR